MSGYESLVEAARVASQKFNPIQQREVVIQALEKAFPRPILSLVKSIYLLCFFYIYNIGWMEKMTCILNYISYMIHASATTLV
jgi:hypothetical protein